jgi:hypothetical protein
MVKVVFGLSMLLFISCKSIVMSTLGVNKNHHFTSRKQVFNYSSSATGLSPEQLLYPDSASMNDFFTHVIDNKKELLLGCFLNDSTEHLNSQFLAQNESCMGRIETEAKTALAAKNDTTIVKQVRSEIMQKILFRHSSDNRMLQPAVLNGKFSVFLLYHSAMGNYHRKSIQRLNQSLSAHGDSARLYCVLMDDVGQLPKH